VDKLGNYTANFEAVGADTGYLPAPKFHTPIAQPQIAIVTKNNDEKGRIQVKFDWQRGNDTTEWIRVMTPDAGSSDQVSKNRGFMAIPEIGDQVMVGFVHNHPDRPYVMGGMFHGKIGAGGGANNAIKSIQTRSGIKIIFNDDEKSLHIEDPSGNTWDMDGQGNISVNAPKNITINAGKDINMIAGENMNIGVGKDMSTNVEGTQENSIGKNQNTSVGETIGITANEMKEEYAENTKTTIGNNQVIETGATDWQTTQRDFSVKSTGKALLQGAKDARVSKR
jgi:uncharacterized protein involved in type VI secretion and phage assembly